MVHTLMKRTGIDSEIQSLVLRMPRLHDQRVIWNLLILAACFLFEGIMHKESANVKKPFKKNQLCWDMHCRIKFNYFIYFNLIIFSLGGDYTAITAITFWKTLTQQWLFLWLSVFTLLCFFVGMFLLLSGVEFLGRIPRIHLYRYYFAWLLWCLIFLLFELSFFVQVFVCTNENRGNHKDAHRIESRLRYIFLLFSSLSNLHLKIY